MKFYMISIEINMDIIAKYIENSCIMVSEKPENFSIKYYIFLVFSHKNLLTKVNTFSQAF